MVETFLQSSPSPSPQTNTDNIPNEDDGNDLFLSSSLPHTDTIPNEDDGNDLPLHSVPDSSYLTSNSSRDGTGFIPSSSYSDDSNGSSDDENNYSFRKPRLHHVSDTSSFEDIAIPLLETSMSSFPSDSSESEASCSLSNSTPEDFILPCSPGCDEYDPRFPSYTHSDRIIDNDMVQYLSNVNFADPNSVWGFIDSFVPDCAEKTAVSLYQELAMSLTTSEQSAFSFDDIEIKVDLLSNQLSDEQLMSNDSIATFIDKIRSCMVDRIWRDSLNRVDKTDKLRQIRGHVKEIISRIRPLDVDFLCSLILRLRFAARDMKDQKVLLFLGPSGVGKSTTLHFLCGSKFREIRCQGHKHFEVLVCDPRVSNVNTSPLPSSATKSVKAVELGYNDLPESHRKSSIFACDTPGFGDTEGCEVDIANGYAIVDFLRSCSEVKPVVFISNKLEGDRWDGLLNLFETLSRILNSDAIKDSIGSFSYVLTKYPDDEIPFFHEKISNFVNGQLPDHIANNHKVVSLIQDIVEKTRNGVLELRPLVDDRHDFLRTLLDDASFIKHPRAAFSPFMTPTSESMLENQLNIIEKSISYSLSEKNVVRFGLKRIIELLKYRMEQLELLSSLEIPNCKDHFQKCLNLVESFIEMKVEGTVKMLSPALNDMELSPEKLYNAVSDIHALETSLRSRFFRRIAGRFEDIFSRIIVEMLDVSRIMYEKLDLSSQRMDPFHRLITQSPLLQDPNTRIRVCNIYHLMTSIQKMNGNCQDVNSVYQASKELILREVDLCSDDVIRYWNERDLDRVASNIPLIRTAEKLFYWESCVSEGQGKYDQCIDRISKEVESILTNSLNSVDNLSNSIGNPQIIPVFDGNFADVSRACRLFENPHFVKTFSEFISHIWTRMNQKYEQLMNSIHVVFRDSKSVLEGFLRANKSNIKSSVKLMISLQSLCSATPYLYSLFKITFNELWHSVRSFAANCFRDAYKYFQKVMNMNTKNFDSTIFEQFENRLTLFFECEGFKEVNGVFEDFRMMEDIIRDYVISVGEEFNSSIYQFSQGLHENLFPLYVNFLKIAHIQRMECVSKDIKDLIAEYRLSFSSKVNRYVEDAVRNVLEGNDDQRCNALLYVDAVQWGNTKFIKVVDVVDKIQSLKEGFIREYFQNLDTDLEGYVGELEIHLDRKLYELRLPDVSDRVNEKVIPGILDILMKFQGMQKDFVTRMDGNDFDESLFKTMFSIRPKESYEKWTNYINFGLKKLVEILSSRATEENLLMELAESSHCISMQLSASFDRFLDDNSNFRSVASNFSTIMKNVDEVGKRAEIAFQEKEYEECANLLKGLPSDERERLKTFILGSYRQHRSKINTLSSYLNDQRETRRYSKPEDTFTDMMSTVTTLKILTQYFNEYLDEHDIPLLNTAVELVKESIVRCIDDLLAASVLYAKDGLHSPNLFTNAIECLEYVKNLFEVLCDLCRRNNIYGEFQELFNILVTKMNDRMMDIRKNLLEFVLKFDNTYFTVHNCELYNPKLCCETWNKHAETYPFFSEAKQQFCSVIQQKYESEVKVIRSLFDREDNLQKLHDKLRSIKKVLDYVPTDIHQELCRQFQTVENLVECKKEMNKSTLNAKEDGEKMKYCVDQVQSCGSIADMLGLNFWKYQTLTSLIIESDKLKVLNYEICLHALRTLLAGWPEWNRYLDILKKFRDQYGITHDRTLLFFDRDFEEIIEDIIKFCRNQINYLLDYRIDSVDLDTLKFTSIFVECRISLFCVNKDQKSLWDKLMNEFRDRLHRFTSDLSSNFKEVFNTSYFYDNRSVLDIQRWMDVLSDGDEFLQIIKNTALDGRRRHLPCHDRSFQEFIESMSKIKTYSDLKLQLTTKVEEWFNKMPNEFFDIGKSDPSDCDDFYKEYFQLFLVLKETPCLQIHVDVPFELKSKFHDIEKKIEEQLNTCSDQIQRSLQTFFSDDYSEFSKLNTALRSFRDHFMDDKLCRLCEEKVSIIDSEFEESLSKWTHRTKDLQISDTDLMNDLISFEKLSFHVRVFQKKVDQAIDDILSFWLKNDTPKVGRLGFALYGRGREQDMFAKLLLGHSAFDYYQIKARNTRTLSFTIEDVLVNTERNRNQGGELNLDRLRYYYEPFCRIYWECIRNGVDQNSYDERRNYLKDLVAKTKISVNALKINGYENYLNLKDLVAKRKISVDKLKDHTIFILSRIFAYWTLNKFYSQNYVSFYELDDEHNDTMFLQPHPAQVVSIFLLLGIDSDRLHNHLIEVKTGEGKSIVLAVTAIFLALFDCEVDCVCYSEYLSNRDYDQFEHLFRAFDVSVRYGTFKDLCESFINQKICIRQRVECLFYDTPCSANAQMNSDRPKILLIDEVDVFFQSDFYGNFYNPVARVSSPEITNLVQKIWELRGSSLSENEMLVNIQNSDKFRVCSEKYTGWETLINECTKEMLSDLNTFDHSDHRYVVVNGKVGYVSQDSITYNTVYGYKTQFAYWRECEKLRNDLEQEETEELNQRLEVLETMRNQKTGLQISCGSFSYAEIPHEFRHILGVTGTLKNLTQRQRDILRNYHIERFTFLPSVYGPNRLRFELENDIFIVEDEQYHRTLHQEVQKRLGERKDRAVLVFFESLEELKRFSKFEDPDHGRFVEFKKLTEEVPIPQREGVIRQAVSSGSVTLLTRAFGRGSDFMCYDERLQENGGVHVITTFLSEDISEEIQIKGRTARQGNPGSFSMVLLYSDLEKYDLKRSRIDRLDRSKMYDVLSSARDRYFSRTNRNVRRVMRTLREKHDAAKQFIRDLENGDMRSVRKYLDRNNRFEM